MIKNGHKSIIQNSCNRNFSSLHQVLVRAGREDQAMMTTLAGLVIVLTMVIKEISGLFDTVRTLFNL